MYGLKGISTRIPGSVFKQNDITEVQIKKTLIPATICERENVKLIEDFHALRLRADRQVFPFECPNRFLMKLHNFFSLLLPSKNFFFSLAHHSNAVDKQQDNQMIYRRTLIATRITHDFALLIPFPQFHNFREACRVCYHHSVPNAMKIYLILKMGST